MLALSNGTDKGSVGDLHGDRAGRGDVGIAMGNLWEDRAGRGSVDLITGVMAGGRVGMGGKGGMRGVIPLNHAGSYRKIQVAAVQLQGWIKSRKR